MSHLLNQHKKRLVGLLDRAFIYVGNNSEVKVGRPTNHVGKLSWVYIYHLNKPYIRLKKSGYMAIRDAYRNGAPFYGGWQWHH